MKLVGTLPNVPLMIKELVWAKVTLHYRRPLLMALSAEINHVFCTYLEFVSCDSQCSCIVFAKLFGNV